MIYTRFGSPIVKVVWYDHETNEIGCVARYEGGTEKARFFHVTDLKADGGIAEIEKACNEAQQRGTSNAQTIFVPGAAN